MVTEARTGTHTHPGDTQAGMTPGRQLPCGFPSGRGTLHPRRVVPRTGLQGSEGDPTPWDGRPAEAESPLLSQGSSSFFSPPPPSLPEPPLGLGPASPRASERGGRLSRARVETATSARSGPRVAGTGERAGEAKQAVEEAEAGVGRR